MGNLPDCCYEYRFNREDSRRVKTCTECGYSIYAGEKYLPVDNKIICRECLDELMEEAEEEF